MSRRWLLSLLCLSVFFLSWVQLTRARGELTVNESRTRVRIQRDSVEVLLAVENSSGQALKAQVRVELLNPRSAITSQTTQTQTIATGDQTLKLNLPLSISQLDNYNGRQLLWHRLRYRLNSDSSNTIAEGILSLSEITSDLFDIRVAASEYAREGGRYRARVLASHPVTRRPTPNVVVEGDITLEDDNDNSVKLHASKTTDDSGYALLEFVLPPRFPQFPHTLRDAGGTIHVVGRKGALSAEAEGEVLVDQVPKILISTDKPIYQPGQVMHIRALVFTPSRRALADQNTLIKISDEEGMALTRTVVKTSRFGVATTDWTIPENARLGDYRISVGIDGDEDSAAAEYGVRVSRYDLPNFTVTVQPDRKYYLPGQNAEIRVRADYLFGQPVRRGHVRVVRETEREWNYREQKYDVEEGETQEGETDADGLFVAHFNLAEAHEDLGDNDNDYFRDRTYAAYFTDPTTNRTEQRRFDLRVTKQPIHVYVLLGHDNNRTLPLEFYISTCYADGSPASTRINVTLNSFTVDFQGSKQFRIGRSLPAMRTNRYGLAKVRAGVPREFDDEDKLELRVSARDANNRTGTRNEEIGLNDSEMIDVETERTIYRPGEPLVASITSTLSNETVIVDVVRESTVIRSESVRLRNGRGSITFPYTPDLKDRLTLAAYTDFPDAQHTVKTRTVLYPTNSELKVAARPSQATYRPGDDAQLRLNVRAANGLSSESALGVVVSDKAVDERFRTEREFGGRFSSFNDTLQRFLGLDEEIAGLTFRDFQRLETAKFISPELDLAAEVLLNQYDSYYPRFYGDDRYLGANLVFSEPVKEQLAPVKTALEKHYARTGQYPNSAASLQSLLAEEGIDFNKVLDPWGVPYRPAFQVEEQLDVLTLMSAGPDKRYETDDDFGGERLSWRYFQPLGKALDQVVRGYHERTSGYIRDLNTLRQEWSKTEAVPLDQLRDRWGKPYRFEFDINEIDYVIKVSSSGPDKQFSNEQYYRGDDFELWTSAIDYFAESRDRIESVLDQHLKSSNQFPQTDQDLRAVLRNSRDSLETLRDPWGRSYYPTFKKQSFYFDRIRVENRSNVGEAPSERTIIDPVTQQVAFVTLRSAGPDGREGTNDDFSVASFTGMLAVQAREKATTGTIPARVVVSASNGAIAGIVADIAGAAIAHAKVIGTGALQGMRRETLSDEDGKYTIGDLPPGLYELRFEYTGFKAHVFTNVPVRVSNVTEVNAFLEPGAVTETVTITAGASALNFSTERSISASWTVNPRDMRVITKSGASLVSTPRLREYFPETLVWQPSIETDKNGRAQIKFKLADNITTWKLAVIGSTADGKIGTTETEIKAFQPFFVDHDPPRVLTEGDEISLPIVVRNYLDATQKVDLQIKPESWFSLLGPARKRIDVAAGDATRQTFDFRAINSVKDGEQRITAIAGDGNDAIEKPITVHPDGEELSLTDSDVLAGSAKLQLNLPDNIIANSSRAELKIYPNLMAHVIESVEAIMSRPYGCGEQTISSTYPSLLLLRNYKKSGEQFPLRGRAERYLNIGYNRLLNYRDEHGGFTYWGHGDPDVALTAYAVRFLNDASEIIAVDKDVISEAQDWLVKKQSADGSWQAHVYSSRPETDRETALLTAYVARVLTMVPGEDSKEKSEALKRALNYLGRRAAEIDEPYLLASYALAAIEMRDFGRAKPIVEKLRSLAHTEGGTTYWSLETNTPFYGWGVAGRIETTALVVQALTRYCGSQMCESDAKLINSALLFLLKQKDRYGVWYSTQATINVLDAMLSLFSQRSGLQGNQSATEIVIDGRVVQTVQIPVGNRPVSPISLDISRFVHTGSNAIEIRRSDESPFASVQALAIYYVPWSVRKSGDLRLQVKFDKTEGKTGGAISCHVEAERVGFAGYGMMLAEIGLPPGADVDRSTLESAMKGSNWAINQYDVLPDRVVVYLWPRAGGVKFDFKFRPRFGLNAKTAASNIYDYYNPESRAVVSPVRFTVKE